MAPFSERHIKHVHKANRHVFCMDYAFHVFNKFIVVACDVQHVLNHSARVMYGAVLLMLFKLIFHLQER